MMRVVIIPSTGTVRKDDDVRDNLNLSSCSVPDGVWALQWNEHGDEQGHIEYKGSSIQNDQISEIPSWANNCLSVLQTKIDEDLALAQAQAAAEAEALAAEQASNDPS